MKNAIIKNRFLALIVVFALAVTAFYGLSGAALTADAATEGSVYYISPDATYGTVGEADNVEKPYNVNTLFASNLLKPGDTVEVMPGQYNITNSITITSSGEYNNYITIENYSDTEQATFAFYNQKFLSTNRGVTIEGDYIYWRDIDVCGAGDNGLYIGGSYNIIEGCEFYDNRDSGLQLGRSNGELTTIDEWPSYNLIKNCTSHNNYDNETYGENADGFAAKLTIGYGNVFDGCIAYRNSDDGWDLYAKNDTGNIGAVIMYNCVAFENGFLEYTQAECNAKFKYYNTGYDESDTTSYDTRDGDGNGFKLGGSVMEGDVVLVNCLAFSNKYHGVTDNSNPGVISLDGVTSYDNNRNVDANGNILKTNTDLGGANIDLARQTYSYNNISNVLSVKSSGVSVVDDAYRASVVNSVFSIGTSSYKVEGSLDADTKNSINGTKITALTSSVFEQLPVEYGTDAASSTYNLTGLRSDGSIHKNYRNSDGSINLGSILAVKTQPLDGVTIGAVLNKSSYDEYEHFSLTNDYSEVTSSEEAILKAASDTLMLACNPDAVYQDFWVPTNMKNVTIEWTSSDEDIVEVTDQEKELTSPSKTDFDYMLVKRDIEEDKTVTVTATIYYGTYSTTKSFDLTIKKDEPVIGDIYITVGGKDIYSGGSYIVNQFAVTTEKEIQVVNGANYSGTQFVKGSQFIDEVTYMYATSKTENFVEVKEFTPSNAGVWHIIHKITLDSSLGAAQTATYDYYIYVASTTAKVTFSTEPQVSVNRDGYMIAGELSNVTGYIYAVSSTEELDVTAENIATYEGVECYSFESDSINFQFANANEGAYHVYYALANMRGEITSDIYHDEISMVEISTCNEFMTIAGGAKLGDEEVSKTIYSLTACLDFSDVTWNAGTEPFKGYIIGNGHTVSNVTTTKTGLFYSVKGGTVADIYFDNIVIEAASSQKVGIFASVYGGTFENIGITNIKAVGGQRTGALIGQIFEASVPTYVRKVSVVNETPELNSDGTLKDESSAYYIKANGNRASSLIGFIQPSSVISGDVIVYVENCYTSTYTWSTGYSISGIVAEYDDAKALTSDYTFLLSIKNCYTSSTLVGSGSSSRIGGMIGYHKGGGTLQILNCLSTMTAYYKSLKVETAQKNISGIVGNCASTGELVSQCATLMDEYNSDYGVTTYSTGMFTGRYGASVITSTLGFDTENVWAFVYVDGGTTLEAPYVELKLATCDC